MSTPEESAVPSELDMTAVEIVAEEATTATTGDNEPDAGDGSGGSPIRPDHVRTQP
jgi:hypothetical protein